MNATVRHHLELHGCCRDGKAAARMAAHVSQIQMRRVVRTVGVHVEAVPLALTVGYGHRAPLAHAKQHSEDKAKAATHPIYTYGTERVAKILNGEDEVKGCLIPLEVLDAIIEAAESAPLN